MEKISTCKDLENLYEELDKLETNLYNEFDHLIGFVDQALEGHAITVKTLQGYRNLVVKIKCLQNDTEKILEAFRWVSWKLEEVLKAQ